MYYAVVRDNMRVWPYCIDCGCRLLLTQIDKSFGKPTLTHFPNEYDKRKDAKDHICQYVNTIVIVEDIDKLIFGV